VCNSLPALPDITRYPAASTCWKTIKRRKKEKEGLKTVEPTLYEGGNGKGVLHPLVCGRGVDRVGEEGGRMQRLLAWPGV
jgi:hypothetical protein